MLVWLCAPYDAALRQHTAGRTLPLVAFSMQHAGLIRESTGLRPPLYTMPDPHCTTVGSKCAMLGATKPHAGLKLCHADTCRWASWTRKTSWCQQARLGRSASTAPMSPKATSTGQKPMKKLLQVCRPCCVHYLDSNLHACLHSHDFCSMLMFALTVPLAWHVHLGFWESCNACGRS